MKDALILVGTSAGGVQALQALFAALPESFANPMAVIQHLPKDAKTEINLVYGGHLPKGVRVIAIEDKTPIAPGHVYFAPGGYHLLVERGGFFSLSQDEPVHFSRPSIDVAFESAAHSLGKRAIGILMTGANEDGARGLHEISEHGGFTFVQDPTEAEVATMPAAALKIFKPSRVGTVKEIGTWLGEFSSGRFCD